MCVCVKKYDDDQAQITSTMHASKTEVNNATISKTWIKMSTFGKIDSSKRKTINIGLKRNEQTNNHTDSSNIVCGPVT